MSDAKERNARNRRAGAEWQSRLLRCFRALGFNTERIPLVGTKDEGDLFIYRPDGTYLLIEAKAGSLKTAEFIKQMEVEKKHFCSARDLDPNKVDAVCIVKRRSSDWTKAYVLTTVEEYFKINNKEIE